MRGSHEQPAPIERFEGAPVAVSAFSPPSVSLRTPVPLAQIIDREQRRRRRHLIVWPLVLLGLLVAGLAVWLVLRPRPMPIAARFRASAVTHGDVVREVRATGHVEAVSTVSVGAEISGRIAAVTVDFNDRVRAGQVLARFDRGALEAQRAQALATVAAARAQVAQAQFDLEQVQRNLDRADGLFMRKAQSEQEHDTAVTAVRLATSRLHAAQAQVEAQEAAHALARTNLDHAVIRAPIDGVVISRNIDPGQTVASMLQTPVLFTVAADLRKMRVIAAVDEADIGEVVVGQQAVATVSGYVDRSFAGAVTEVRNSPVVVQDVVTYGAVVTVSNPDLALRPGMTATVRLRVASERDVDRVPNAALHFTPPGEVRQATSEVWVLDGDRPRRVAVRSGVSDGELTAIAPGSGLPAGAQVLVELTQAGKKAYGLDRRP